MYCGYRTERRKFKRLRVNLSVLCRVMWPRSIMELTAGKEFEAKTLDLSEGGMALSVMQHLPRGTKLFCKFVMFESNGKGEVKFHEIVNVFAGVQDLTLIDDIYYRIGLTFEELDEDKRCVICDIMNSPLKYETPPSRIYSS